MISNDYQTPLLSRYKQTKGQRNKFMQLQVLRLQIMSIQSATF